MNNPITANTFRTLVDVRNQIGESARRSTTRTAGPFVPWIGSNLLTGVPGIYFIGISTRGAAGDSDAFEESNGWTEYVVNHPSGPFWAYIKAVLVGVYGGSDCDHRESFGWSNQFKIGVFDANRPEYSLNPRGKFAKQQLAICSEVLRDELQVVAGSAVVLMGDTPVIDPVFGKDCWDKNKYAHAAIWTKQDDNGSLILYQYHPSYLNRRDGRKPSLEVNSSTVISAVRDHLGLRADVASQHR